MRGLWKPRVSCVTAEIMYVYINENLTLLQQHCDMTTHVSMLGKCNTGLFRSSIWQYKQLTGRDIALVIKQE